MSTSLLRVPFQRVCNKNNSTSLPTIELWAGGPSKPRFDLSGAVRAEHNIPPARSRFRAVHSDPISTRPSRLKIVILGSVLRDEGPAREGWYSNHKDRLSSLPNNRKRSQRPTTNDQRPVLQMQFQFV